MADMDGYDISFQSTLSMRRATMPRIRKTTRQFISIHALHEESDPTETSQ